MDHETWVRHYEPGVPPTLDSDDGLFHGILQTAAAGAPGLPAIAASNRTVGFAEAEALTGRVAAALLRDDVHVGDRVLIALPDSLPLAATALGAMRVGAVVSALDPQSPASTVAEVARRLKPAIVVAANGVARHLSGGDVPLVVVRAVDQLPPFLRLVYRVGAPGSWRKDVNGPPGARRWRDWLAKRAPAAEIEVSPHDPAWAVLGDDVGEVTFTHAQLAAGARQMEAWLTDATPGDDTWLMLAPLWTTFGIVAGLGTSMLLRACVALVPGRGAGDLLEALRYVRPDYVAADAGAIRTLVAAPSLSRPDFRDVHACVVAGPLARELEHQFELATDQSVCQGFAPSCAAGLATCNPVNGRRSAGSVGLPLPGVSVRLVDDEGHVLPDDGEGWLEFRGPNTTSPRSWQSARTRGTLDPSGYVHLAGSAGEAPRAAALRGGST